MLDAKIASSLKKIIQNFYFKKRVNLMKRKAQLDERFLRGRLIAFMIYDYFRVTDAHEVVLDYSDLFRITLLHGDDVQDFDTRWDEVLLSIKKVHSDDILESLYKMRTREFDQIRTRNQSTPLTAELSEIEEHG